MRSVRLRRAVLIAATLVLIGVWGVSLATWGPTSPPSAHRNQGSTSLAEGAPEPMGRGTPDAFAGPPSIGVRDCSGVRIRPGESVQRNIDAHPPGTTFCLERGIHRLRTPLVPKDRQKFVGEPGAILSGARILPSDSFERQGGYWVIDRQTQESPPAGICRPATYSGCQFAEGVFFDDSNLWQVTSLSKISRGAFFFDYADDKIYLAQNPARHIVEASITPSVFTSSAATHVLIRGLIVEKFANPAQTAALPLGDSWEAIGNEIRLNHGAGLRTETDTVVRGNYIHDQGQLGIGGYGDTGALIVKNEIAFNNTEGFEPGWEAGGAKWVKNAKLTVRGNFVHDNDGQGLWTDTDNIDTVYENNHLVRNEGVGILHEASYDAIIRHNYVARNAVANVWLDGAGILISDSGNVEIYDNRVVMNGDGIGLKQSDRGSGAYGPWVVSNVYVHDNVITMCKGWTGAGRTEGTDTAIYGGSNRFENNSYYLDARSAERWYWQDAEIDRTTWQSYGQDASGTFRISERC